MPPCGSFTGFLNSPLGVIRFTGSEKFISEITFTGDPHMPGADIHLPFLLEKCRRELMSYFEGTLREFTVAVQPAGTGFQKRIWQQLASVPFGSTRSYLDLAKNSGDANNTRAVGNANGKNPVAIVIPCHRVIGSSGNLTGYAGGLWRKKWLLDHEAKIAHGVLELF